MAYYFRKMKSPVGELTLVANDESLVSILWDGLDNENAELLSAQELGSGTRHSLLDEAENQLKEYFQGKRHDFTVPIHFEGGTKFQNRVWKMLRKIPYGKTWSYGKLAKSIGSPKAVRAVGAANGRNPLSIIVPCHRVIGANGSLTGFGGGLKNKKILLDLESQSAL